jgi:hypothetical protein
MRIALVLAACRKPLDGVDVLSQLFSISFLASCTARGDR